ARASALPERTRSAEAFPPRTSPSAVSSRLFPAPVSPVQAQNPPSSSTWTSSINARFCTESSRNTTKGPPNPWGNRPDAGPMPRHQPVRAFHLTILGPAVQTPAGSRTDRRHTCSTASFLVLHVPHVERD